VIDNGIIYLSSPHFFDYDLSFIKSISNKIKVNFLMDLAPHSLKASSVNIDKQIKRNGIIPLKSYREFDFFDFFLNGSDNLIINRRSSKIFSLKNWVIQFKILKYLRKSDCKILHINNTLSPIYFLPILFSGKIIVTNFHDPFIHTGEKKTFLDFQRKLYIKISNRIIIFNENQKNDFIEQNNIPFYKVFVSKLGLYSHFKLYQNKEPSLNYPKTFLFIGRISKYKGIDLLLRAFASIKDQNINLIIAGAGKFWFDLDPYINDSRIKIINRYLKNEEVTSLITSSTAVICPYIDSTQSGVVMTAFALNKPIIATKTGGLDESVIDNKTGLLITPKSTEAIKTAILKFIEEPEISNYFSTNISNLYNGSG
jgi:glycosyltransferase involved in cell wall biosynthesis